MTFDLTPTAAQHDLARRAHEFAESVIRPVALDYDQKQEFPWPVLEEAAQRGFYSPLFYRDLIGDPTGISLPMFMEELFWGCAGIGLAIVMPALALSAIGQAASPEQMLEWAPQCFGSPGDLKLAALAISEPEGGSDVRNLRTTAKRDGSDWILDGHKMWIGNGGIADVHVVNAVVDEELGHRGQALFIVPGGTPGLELVRKLDKLGCRASHTAELKFNGVRVPAENLLGGQEKLEHKLAKAREVVAGGKRSGSATLGTFEQTRPMVAAQAIGIARAALEYATTYATQREAFGGPIMDNQGIAFPLAEIATQIDAARLLTWRASWMAARGSPSSAARARCRRWRPARSRYGRPSGPFRHWAAGDTSTTIRSKSGIGMPSCTPSLKVPVKSSGSSSPLPSATTKGLRRCTSNSNRPAARSIGCSAAAPCCAAELPTRRLPPRTGFPSRSCGSPCRSCGPREDN